MGSVQTGRDVGFFLDKYLAGAAPERLEKLRALARLHERYREAARLSSPLSPEAYVVHLILDSLKLAELAPPEAGEKVADVGSGGGYPGLPTAISCPEAHFTLIEQTRRKAEYLRLAAAELDLTNVDVEARPAGEIDAGTFDVVCSKALAQGEAALKIMLPLVRPGGRAVMFLGDYEENALADLKQQAESAGGRVAATHRYELPTLDRPRLLAEVTKV
ncbi:MAG: 16S rRNA (guanine(527)-N(7))-methyltransferase RsmG [Candidatus Zixiibacteriota bacterium]